MNDYALGKDMYPVTLHNTLQVMLVHQDSLAHRAIMKKVKAKKDKDKIGDGEELVVSFAQMAKDKMRKKGLCFNCGHKWQPGHKCKKKKEQTEEAR